MYEDFEQEFKDEVLEFEEEQERKKELKSRKKKQTSIEEKDIRNSIKSKLTKEEMKYVAFKSFNNEF